MAWDLGPLSRGTTWGIEKKPWNITASVRSTPSGGGGRTDNYDPYGQGSQYGPSAYGAYWQPGVTGRGEPQRNLLFGYDTSQLGPSGSNFRQRDSLSALSAQTSPLIDRLKQFSNIDPNSIFSNYYQGLKAMGSVGIESNKQYQLAKQALEDKLRNSQSGLMGDLSGIEEARLFNILNQDKALYATNTAELDRMKKFLLYTLQNANQQRAEQRGYLGDQKGFVERALQSALAQSQEDKAAGARIRDVNLREILSEAGGRGAAGSMGTELGRGDQKAQFKELVTQLQRRDTNSRLDRDKAMRDIQSKLEQLDLGEKMDELKAREDLAGYDSERARLDANQNKIGYNFMAAVAKLRAEEKARKDQEQLMRFYSGLEQQRIQREAAEAQQRANQQAFFGAIAQQQQADQGLYNAYASIGEANGRKMLQELARRGDNTEFNKLKLWGRRLGWW